MKTAIITLALFCLSVQLLVGQTLSSGYVAGTAYNINSVSLINRVFQKNYTSLPTSATCNTPGNYSWLTAGQVTNFYQYYSPQISCQSGYCGNGMHTGIDLHGCTSNAVYSPLSGVVQSVSPPAPNGNGTVAIWNSTYQLTFLFIHLSVVNVTQGASIAVNQQIGYVGNSGVPAVHLHLELRSGQRTGGACPCDALSTQAVYDPHIIMNFFPASCNAPTNLTVSSITSNSANISFAGSGYSNYEVSYASNGNSNWYTVVNNSNPIYLTGLSSGTTYNLRLRFNCNGAYSSYSTTSFTTLSSICQPVSYVGSYNMTCNASTVYWGSVSGASYKLYYWSGTSWIYFYSTASTSVALGLQPNSTYYIGVQAVCTSTQANTVAYTLIQTPSCGNHKMLPDSVAQPSTRGAMAAVGSGPTLVTTLPARNELTIFPNPARDKVVLQSQSTIKMVFLQSMDGRNIRTYTGGTMELELPSFLSPGIYILRILTDNGTVTRKFQKY